MLAVRPPADADATTGWWLRCGVGTLIAQPRRRFSPVAADAAPLAPICRRVAPHHDASIRRQAQVVIVVCCRCAIHTTISVFTLDLAGAAQAQLLLHVKTGWHSWVPCDVTAMNHLAMMMSKPAWKHDHAHRDDDGGRLHLVCVERDETPAVVGEAYPSAKIRYQPWSHAKRELQPLPFLQPTDLGISRGISRREWILLPLRRPLRPLLPQPTLPRPAASALRWRRRWPTSLAQAKPKLAELEATHREAVALSKLSARNLTDKRKEARAKAVEKAATAMQKQRSLVENTEAKIDAMRQSKQIKEAASGCGEAGGSGGQG